MRDTTAEWIAQLKGIKFKLSSTGGERGAERAAR